MALAVLAKNGIPPDQAGAMSEEAVFATLDCLAELAGRKTGATATARHVNTRRRKMP